MERQHLIESGTPGRTLKQTPCGRARIGSVSQNAPNGAASVSESVTPGKTHKQTQPDWFCSAKSRQRAGTSRPTIAKRTNKPNRARPRIGSVPQNHDNKPK